MDVEERLDQLTSRADAIVTALDNSQKRDKRWRKLTAAVSVGLLLDLAITIVLTTVVNDQADTNRKLKQALAQNYTTSQQQLQTRTDFLCPLYQLLIAATDDPSRQTDLTPAQRDITDKVSQSLHKQYNKLKCPDPTAP